MVKKGKTGALEGEIFPPEQDDSDASGNKGGQPEHAPTQKLRDNVEVLAGRGVKQHSIAAIIGISWPTLRKHYAKELVLGDAKVQAALGQAGLTQALGAPAEYYPPGHINEGKLARAEIMPDKSLLIFLLKTRLGLVESYDVNMNNERLAQDAEFNTAGLTNSERVTRIAGLLDAARARRTGRAAERAGPVGGVSEQPTGSSVQKRG